MSLIFEALKKLDREKQVPERGFVVVAQAPWPASRRKRLVWLAVGSGVVLASGLVGFALLRPSPSSVTTGVGVGQSPAAAAPAAVAPAAPPAVVASLPPPGDAQPLTTPSKPPANQALATRPPKPEAPAAADRGSRTGGQPAPAGPSAPKAGDSDSQARDRAGPLPSTVGPAPAPLWEQPASPSRENPPASRPSSPTSGDSLRLEAISEREGKPVAIVSGRLVREGDNFDGVRILRIGPTEVEIEVEGHRRTLRF